MQQGKYLGGQIPYGYRKDENAEGMYAADGEAASIVQRIFACACQGMTTGEIAKALNKEGVETPGQNYMRRHPENGRYKNSSEKPCWTTSRIQCILHNEVYYGAYVGHRREAVVPCSRKTKKVPKEELILLENHHEALVSKVDWIRAQNCIRKVSNSSAMVKKIYPLKGLARCGYCGRLLHYNSRAKEPYFSCLPSLNSVEDACFRGKLPEAAINEAVLESIRTLISGAEKAAGAEMRPAQTPAVSAAEIEELQRKISLCGNERLENIEKLNTGSITKEEYFFRRNQIKAREVGLRKELTDLTEAQDREAAECDPDMKRLREAGKKFKEEERLTAEMAYVFLQEVQIYSPERIEIRWRFRDDVILDVTKNA